MKYTPLIAALGLMPGAALAHSGPHGLGSFGSGVAHPLGGADHLLAMLVLGVLATQIGGRAMWALPSTFVLAMLAGGIAGAAGWVFPAVEPMILASVMVLGAMVALVRQPGLPVLVGAVALFGVAHGWAHGAEGPAQGLVAYSTGFVLATALLHAAGLALGRAAPALALRLTGAGTVLAGLVLAVA